MSNDKLPIVAITGTKGKSTATNMTARLLYTLGKDTLHVTTSGHFINGQQRSTAIDSKYLWGLKTPTLVPGRYIADLLSDGRDYQNAAAVLEASFSCYKAGLGYSRHKVGVFLNIFEDHIDQASEIRNRQELARAKSFIFSKINRDGWAVFNADDKYVCSVLDAVGSNRNVKLIPCGRDFTYYDIKSHLLNGGVAIQITDKAIVLLSAEGSSELYAFRNDDMTYGGTFGPAVWNLAHACGAVYGFYDGQLPNGFRTAIDRLPLDYGDGRMKVMRANGLTVVADYAHEKESLRAVADFARSRVADGGKLIGVVRLNHERPDEVIQEFGQLAGSLFDTVVVYDKIDEHWRHAKRSGIKRYPEVAGRTSTIVVEAAAKVNDQSYRIVREDKAVAYAATWAKEGDVVVVIVNDDTDRSMAFIRDSFKLSSDSNL